MIFPTTFNWVAAVRSADEGRDRFYIAARASLTVGRAAEHASSRIGAAAPGYCVTAWVRPAGGHSAWMRGTGADQATLRHRHALDVDGRAAIPESCDTVNR